MSGSKLMTCKQVAQHFGMSEEFVRAACYRGDAYHPMPHIRYGKKRNYIRIYERMADEWMEEEMRCTKKQ